MSTKLLMSTRVFLIDRIKHYDDMVASLDNTDTGLLQFASDMLTRLQWQLTDTENKLHSLGGSNH